MYFCNDLVLTLLLTLVLKWVLIILPISAVILATVFALDLGLILALVEINSMFSTSFSTKRLCPLSYYAISEPSIIQHQPNTQLQRWMRCDMRLLMVITIIIALSHNDYNRAESKRSIPECTQLHRVRGASVTASRWTMAGDDDDDCLWSKFCALCVYL